MRISASDLDTLRYYETNEDVPLEKVVSDLLRKEPPTDKMRAGTALHKFLETCDAGISVTDFEQDGFRFHFNFNGELPIPVIRELKAEKVFVIDGEPHTLVGKIDALHGRTGYDHKFTGQFDPEKWLYAYQWKAYLSVFELDRFVYNVFVGSYLKTKGYWNIREFHALPFERYPSLDEDLIAGMRRFVEFCKEHVPEKYNAPNEKLTGRQTEGVTQ